MSDDRADDAATRRRSAELPAEELRGLRERLEGGDRLTPDDVALARRRLAEAEHLAQTAHDRAATAHEEAAERHVGRPRSPNDPDTRTKPWPTVAPPSRSSPPRSRTDGTESWACRAADLLTESRGGEAQARAKRDVVVVGASAGGVEALRDLVSALPADLPATLLVVLQVPANGTSALPDILSRVGPLPARHARGDDPLEHGPILVAPPDRHLVAHRTGVTLSQGPKENGHRPAVDVLFRSAARAYGARVVSVVLSGALDDGAAGTVAVTLRGGVGLAQDPGEALHPSMPRAAAGAAGLELVLPVKEIARTLVQLVGQDAPGGGGGFSGLMDAEVDMADLDLEALTDPDRPGDPSGWTCPDCSGSLFTIEEGRLTRFRCRVGHAWSADSLVAQQSASFETAL